MIVSKFYFISFSILYFCYNVWASRQSQNLKSLDMGLSQTFYLFTSLVDFNVFFLFPSVLMILHPLLSLLRFDISISFQPIRYSILSLGIANIKKWKSKWIGKSLRKKMYTQCPPFYFPPLASLLYFLSLFVPCTFTCTSLTLSLIYVNFGISTLCIG